MTKDLSHNIQKLTDEELKDARPSLEKLKEIERFPVVVLIENIRSLYNVGSIFRTSDGALIEKLYLTGYTGYPPRKEIDKTSLGSVNSVPWEYIEDPLTAANKLKDQGYALAALEHTVQSTVITETVYPFPLCLVLGNEVDGISEDLLSLCDMAVEIPMYGIKQSLNVAVAYGIAVYHIVEFYQKTKI